MHYKIVFLKLGVCLFLFFSITFLRAQNPLIMPGEESFPDVCFVSVGDIIYAFGGTDIEPKEITNGHNFNMVSWRCFSSKDMVNWTLESEVYPEDTYIGKSDQCWASHAVCKNDKWYWYLSNWHDNTAVVVADSPKGPWKDPLGKSLLHEEMTKTREYDNCVFIDDDKRAYIVFGINNVGRYHIAELNDDMVSLKEKPKIIPNNLPNATDAPFLHKINGQYYLSSRNEYAVAENVYGPYEFKGFHGAGGHSGYFSFNNQDYVNYTTRKPDYRVSYRFCSVAYVHYRADGTIVTREKKIDEYGVGQYNANWNKIEAEWFFAMPDGPVKTETQNGGFEISNLRNGDYLCFPNIDNCKDEAVLKLRYACSGKGGKVIIREDNEKGKKIGQMKFGTTDSWNEYGTIAIQLKNRNKKNSIALVFEGKSSDELIRVDSFSLE